jgi:DNA polymerase-3 subunit alpha
VQDFIAAGRSLGVAVGPGRGSAAGSAVAYCVGITNIDPIKYNLLFERFLNPERVSMPDIDIDFDDQGRQQVIDYVVDKYGKNQVAQIVTFGTMAAKSSIKDVARVLDLPLPQSNRLANLVPTVVGMTLPKAFSEVQELQDLRRGKDINGEVLQLAEKLEGSVRNTGPQNPYHYQRCAGHDQEKPWGGHRH